MEPGAKFSLPPISQIGIVVKNLEKTMNYYSTTFGLGPFKVMEVDVPNITYRGKKINLKGLKMAFADLKSIELELIEVPKGENIYSEFFKKKGEGLHHIGFQVTDVDEMIAKFKSFGIGVIQGGGGEAGSFAYMDTEKIGGVILEFVHYNKT